MREGRRRRWRRRMREGQGRMEKMYLQVWLEYCIRNLHEWI